MAESLAPNSANPPVDLVGARRRCDALCDEFEQAWQRGERPNVESFAARVPITERANLLRELVGLDCAYRREAGEQPQPADYQVAAGEFSRIIEEALSTRLRHNSSTGRFDRQLISTISPDRSSAPEKNREQIGDYKILSEIARGGMGVVYKAQHRTLDRTAAVKLIRGGDQAGEEELRRFQIEASAAAQLDHPAIVPVYELGQHDGQPYLAMAFVDGTSLWTRVKEAPLEPPFAATIMQRVAEGVQYAHDHGIIHRDLKPQNILLAADDQPRITDFGLAKHHWSDSSLTATGQILGTPSYMPPEQASGKDETVGPLADVYSLGATLYCLLVGHPPFQAAQPVETLRQVIEQEPVPPRVLNRGIPRDLETICLKCLQKNPTKRYTSAREFAADLQRYLRGEPIQARAIGPLERVGRWSARNRVVAGLGSTAIVLLATVAAISTWAYFQQAALVTQKTKLISEKVKLLTEKEGLLTEKETLIGEKDQLAKGERKQRLSAEQELYNSQIARSHAEIERGNLIAANLALNSIPFPLRNWEHRYLTRRAQGTPFHLEGQVGQCMSAQFSPDGQWVASGGQDGVLRLWNANTGRLEKSLEGHPQMIDDLAFGPDQRLATVDVDGTLILWDLNTDRPLHTIKVPNPMRAFPQLMLDFARDGKFLATGGFDGIVRLWDCETGQEKLKFSVGPGKTHSLSIHPDGSRIAVVVWKDRSGEVKVFAAADGKQLFTLEGKRAFYMVVRHSPDGRYLATGADENAGVELWNAATGAKVRSFDSKGGSVVDLCFSPDGTLLVAGSLDKSVRLLDVRAGNEAGRYLGHQYTARSVDFSPDGTRAISVGMENSSSELKIWNVTQPPGDPVLRVPMTRAAVVDFNRQGTLLASGSDGTIKIWDVRTRRALQTLRARYYSLLSIAFDHSGKQLASVSYHPERKGEVTVWNVETGAEKFILGHKDQIITAEFSRDDKFLATASTDGTAIIWDVATQAKVATLEGHNGELRGLAFHPNGQWLMTLSKGVYTEANRPGQRILWKVPTWERIKEFQHPALQVPPGEYTPDGEWLLAANGNGELILRSAEDSSIRHILRGHNADLSGFAVNHDGSRLFSSSYDRSLKVWDLDHGKELLTISFGNIIPAALAIHPADQLVAQGLTDNTGVRLFDATLDQEECWLRGHTSPIALMGVTKDGRLVTQESSGTALVWDIVTGRRVEERISAVKFERVRALSGLELRFGESIIDICPHDTNVARLRRNIKPADRDDLWTLDAARRQAIARVRHRSLAAVAEAADDPFAAAYHWKALTSLEAKDANAAAKYDAAVEKLKERNLPVPP